MPSVDDGHYFGLAELRALPDMDDSGKYSDTVLGMARDWIEGIVERWCQTSFIPKTATETLDGDDAGKYGGLQLNASWVQSVTAVIINGTALSADDLAGLAVHPDGRIERFKAPDSDYPDYGIGWTGQPTPWPRGRRNIVVTYTYGYSTVPPLDLKQEMLTAARYRVLTSFGSSGIPDRALSMQTDSGNIVMAQPGTKRAVGIPSVDECIAGWAAITVHDGIA